MSLLQKSIDAKSRTPAKKTAKKAPAKAAKPKKAAGKPTKRAKAGR
jgi:DNA end-binding protein Ku